MAFPEGLSPAQLLFPDLDNEIAATRKLVALVPDGNDAFRPHEKSMKLAALASHLVDLLAFGKRLVTTDVLDFATTPWVSSSHATTKERLANFDERAAELKATITGASWEDVSRTFQMRMGDTVFADDPKYRVIRTTGISHIAHHRAQLGVYLRMLGIAIPGTYGPSADEM